MKILHVIDHLGLGGAQTVLAEILSSWPVPSDIITVLALGGSAELRERLEPIHNVTVEICGYSKWDPRSVGRVASEIREGCYDVVHAHLTKSQCSVLASLTRMNAKRVIHLHGDPTRDHFALRSSLRIWRKRIDRIVAVSSNTALIGKTAIPELAERITIIHNGVNFSTLDHAFAPSCLREEFGIAADDLLLGFVGRLAQPKGVTYLLRAAALVLKRQQAINLLIIGDGPLRKQLEAEAARLKICKHVHFVGFRPNGRCWMRQFDVGVLPSLHEGLPMTLIEMMGVGLPIVATSVGGTPEIVRHQRSGLLVPPRDVDRLAGALLTYAQQRQLRLAHGEAAKQDVRERFCVRRTAAKLRALYIDIDNDDAARDRAAAVDSYHFP